jgi:ABC-type antimicrobial peptide transport system permease subunit
MKGYSIFYFDENADLMPASLRFGYQHYYHTLGEAENALSSSIYGTGFIFTIIPIYDGITL